MATVVDYFTAFKLIQNQRSSPHDTQDKRDMVRGFFSPDLAKSAGLNEHRFPENDEEASAAEAALSNELAKMSLNEHEKILLEIHGFSESREEDPEIVESRLAEFEKEISSIKKKSAYERAKCLNKTYVESRELRLTFLRCESFRARSAAELLVLHFEVKRELFGNGEVLARDIRQSDLPEGSRAILESGILQVLGERDVSGRTVFCFRPTPQEVTNMTQFPVDDLRCVIWYFFMAALRDVEAQKNGIVMAIFNFKGWTADMGFMKRVHTVRTVLPQRLVGVHTCYNDESLQPFLAGVRLFLDRDSRVRVRLHMGEPEEALFQLQTFGIPTQHCPLQKDGSWSVAWHQEWLQLQRLRETAEVERIESLGILIPGRFDVLFGKTKSAREHTGNMRLLHLCEMNRDSYEAADKYGKTEIADRLVSIICESNGRFLKWGDSGWLEANHDVAREKVSHYFRHMRSKDLKSENDPRTSVKRRTPTPSSSSVES